VFYPANLNPHHDDAFYDLVGVGDADDDDGRSKKDI
jgi:hypothetical protein